MRFARFPSKVNAHCQFRIARLNEFVPLPRLRDRAASEMLVAGLPNGEWQELNVLRKVIGGREIGVAVYEDAADKEY